MTNNSCYFFLNVHFEYLILTLSLFMITSNSKLRRCFSPAETLHFFPIPPHPPSPTSPASSLRSHCRAVTMTVDCLQKSTRRERDRLTTFKFRQDAGTRTERKCRWSYSRSYSCADVWQPVNIEGLFINIFNGIFVRRFLLSVMLVEETCSEKLIWTLVLQLGSPKLVVSEKHHEIDTICLIHRF